MTHSHGADLQRQKDKRVLEVDPGRVSLCGDSDAEDGGQVQDVDPDEKRTTEDCAVKRGDGMQDRSRGKVIRQTLGVGIRDRLGRRHGLNAEGFESVTELAGRLLLRLRAIAAFLHHRAAGHREKTGVSIER